MSTQRALMFDEDFIADARSSKLPDEPMARCYGCHHICLKTELSGGLCSDCADPIDEEDDEEILLTFETKGPGVMTTGGLNQVPGMTRRAVQG